jgi:hypothetical protein
MPLFAITGPLGEEAIRYPPLTAPGPLEALHRLHADALGNHRVRLEGQRLVFVDPAERELCAGV